MIEILNRKLRALNILLLNRRGSRRMVRESVLIKRILWTAAIVLLSLLLITSPALAEGEAPPEPAPETETAAADAEPVEGSASEGDQSSAGPEEPVVEESDPESPVVETPTEEAENSSDEAEDSPGESPATQDEDTEVDLEDNPEGEVLPSEAEEDLDDDTQPAEETAEVVEALAEEDLTLADGEGDALNLAAEESADSLSGADPYFYVGSTMYQFLPDGMACPPGTEGSTCWVSDPSDNPIQDAIDYINANGTVPSNRMIYVESGTYTGDVTLDTSTDILSSMINGLIGAGSSTTTIVGDVTIHQNAGGFTLSGFSIEGGLSITESVGTLTLEDLDVSGSDMDGIYVHNQSGNVNVTNTKSSGNDAYGAYIYHEETSGSVTINNSEFNDNGSTLNDFYDVGLYIETAGKVTLEGVSASGNLGRGIEVFDFSALTIYYATANYNHEPYFVDEKGDGIYAFTDKTATVKLENLQANYNADDGIYISTNGSVSAKNIEAQFNTIRTGSIAVQEMVGEYLSADMEYDEWRFDGIIGQDVTVTLETFGGPLDFDPLVRLYDSSYTLLGEDDNTMDGWNATLDYTLPADGVYYVRVYRAYGTQSSRYEMGINYSNTFEDYYERGGSGFTFRTWDGKGKLKIQNSFFNENADDGLHVSSRNSVTISTITSTNNGYDGVYVNKSGGDWNCPEGGGACTLLGYSGAGTVTITSPKSTGWLTANAVSGNGGAGIYVFSRGNVSVYNVDAFSNGSGGLNLNTCLGDYYTNFCQGSGNISVGVSIPNWDNYIGENSGIGIKIDSGGSVSLSGTQANYNGMKGVHVDALSNIALKDMEVFHNYDTGAFLSTLASLRARNVTVTDSTFDNNDGTGLIIHTQGTINLKGVSADDNLSPISGTLDSVPISVYDQIYYGNTTEIYYFYGYGGFWLDILLESTDFDAFLQLTNNVGDPIIFNDNSGGGTDARIIYALPYTGWFQIEVSFVGTEEFGDYILSVNDADHTVKMYPGSGVELDTTFGSGDIKVYTTRSTPQLTFSENDNFGFYAVSNGRVIIDGVSANRNYRSGLHVESVKNVEVKDKSKYPSATFDENGRYGIYVHTLGSITLYSVSASSNIINGADLENCAYDLDLLECTGSGNITVSMRKKNLAEFSGNGGYGIKAEASRNISIYNASANENGLSGLFLQNYLGLGKIYVQNKNKVPDSTFNDNGGYGILVKSDKYIKLHNVSANSNLYSGAYLDNCRESFGLCFGDGAISITSSKNVLSSFDNNEEHGILAYSLDSLVLTNITANSNGLSGAYLMNNYESSRGIVKIKSSGSVLNQFNDNGGAEDYAGSAPDYRVGLYIETRGKVSISSLEAARTLDGGMSANWYRSPYGGSGMLVSNNNGLDENSLSVTYGTF